MHFYKTISLSLIVFAIIFFSSNNSLAQHHEFGLGAGAFNYAGDLQRGYQFQSLRPGGQLFYRYNFNPIVSFRGSLTGGLLAGSDQKPIDPFAQIRNTEFSLWLTELSADIEYNFLDIKSSKSLNNWTPYLFVGLGGFLITGDNPVNGAGQYSSFQPNVPFGGGVKMELSPYFNLGVEFGFRKLFTDWIDDVSSANSSVKNYRYGNQYDNDWYNFFGVTLSYTIYAVDCPYDFYNTQTNK